MIGPSEAISDVDEELQEQLVEWCFYAWSSDEARRRQDGIEPFTSESFERPLC